MIIRLLAGKNNFQVDCYFKKFLLFRIFKQDIFSEGCVLRRKKRNQVRLIVLGGQLSLFIIKVISFCRLVLCQIEFRFMFQYSIDD